MKNYIICAPSYACSNGIRVLHFLSKILEENGYNAYMFSPAPHHKDYKYVEKITDDMRKNAIVVYPEIVKGNPLGFQNVVRYVLYYPGVLGGNKEYHSSEMIFAYDRVFTTLGNVLTVPFLDTTIFYDDASPKRQDCYFVYKGGKWKEAIETSGLLEINMHYPDTREKLADLLRTTGTLYSYDNHTALLEEAIFCGCKVKIITNEGVKDYQSRYFESIKDFGEQLVNFINVTQNNNYQGEIEKTATFKLKYIMKIFLYRYILINPKKCKQYEDKFNRNIVF